MASIATSRTAPDPARRFEAVRPGPWTSIRRVVPTILRYVLLIVLAVIFLTPFYLIVRNALMTQAEITSFDWAWWPAQPQWQNLPALFNDPDAPMGTGLRNSAIIAVTNLLLQTLFASMAGYALARMPVRGRDLVFFAILSTLMVPASSISTGKSK